MYSITNKGPTIIEMGRAGGDIIAVGFELVLF